MPWRWGATVIVLPMVSRRSFLVLAWKVHKLVWRLSGGRLGTRTIGMPVLELITTGRKSGEPRSVLLTYMEHGAAYAVIASNAGHTTDPSWWRNLEAQPRATVRIQSRDILVVARRAVDEEREELWARAVATSSDYAEYAAQTDRDIPVVVLDPA